MALYADCHWDTLSLGSLDPWQGWVLFFAAAGREAMRFTDIGAGRMKMGTAEFAEGAEDNQRIDFLFSSSPPRPLRPLR